MRDEESAGVNPRRKSAYEKIEDKHHRTTKGHDAL